MFTHFNQESEIDSSWVRPLEAPQKVLIAGEIRERRGLQNIILLDEDVRKDNECLITEV